MLLGVLLAGAVLATTPSAPADGTYRGTTPTDGQAVRIVVKDGQITHAVVTVRRYRCTPEGEIGPLRVAVDLSVPVRRKHKFSFTAGMSPSYLKMNGTFSRTGRLTGRLRAYGTIGTGDPCTSPTRGYEARRVAPR